MTADLLLVNANVLTMDPARPRASSVALAGGRIVAVDPDRDRLHPRQVADLRGATLLPGFHDAHNHMAWFGLTLTEIEQALRAYTAGSAYASHAENRKGMIAPGRLADLTVLSDDPVAVSPAGIGGIEVLATFVDGQCRFDATGDWSSLLYGALAGAQDVLLEHEEDDRHRDRHRQRGRQLQRVLRAGSQLAADQPSDAGGERVQ